MPTICAECIHLHQKNASDPPWRWMCSKHKRLEGFGFVTRDIWDKFPPYLFCNDVNGGACPLFEKALTPDEQQAVYQRMKAGVVDG